MLIIVVFQWLIAQRATTVNTVDARNKCLWVCVPVCRWFKVKVYTMFCGNACMHACLTWKTMLPTIVMCVKKSNNDIF